jgi:large subunit ribosomal protein L22
MEFEATGKYLRISTRKMRLVADAVMRMNVLVALDTLNRVPKHAAKILSEVMKSAVANAKGRNVDGKDLKIKEIIVMGGPAMKRWHAVSRGMAHAFKKRMTHVRVILQTIHDGKEGVKKVTKPTIEGKKEKNSETKKEKGVK